MSNPAMPGLVKVGFTTDTPDVRARELYTTGVPLPFKVEFAKGFISCCHFTLALVYLNGHRWLIVISGGEGLGKLSGNGCVLGDHFGHDST